METDEFQLSEETPNSEGTEMTTRSGRLRFRRKSQLSVNHVDYAEFEYVRS